MVKKIIDVGLNKIVDRPEGLSAEEEQSIYQHNEKVLLDNGAELAAFIHEILPVWNIETELAREALANLVSEIIKTTNAESILKLSTDFYDNAELISSIFGGLELLSSIDPYLQEEIKKPEYLGKTIAELEKEGTTEDGSIIEGSLYDLALSNARAAKYGKPAPAEVLPRIQAKKPRNVALDLSKYGNFVFADWVDRVNEINGQITMEPLKMEKDGRPELTLFYDLTFPEDVAISNRKLSPFDQRVYSVLHWLKASGNDYVTPREIAGLMGSTTKLNNRQIKKVLSSIDKMIGVTISWDDHEEAAAYHDRDTYSDYKGLLCPIERVAKKMIINGKPVDFVVHIFRTMPLIDFAINRKNYTTIPHALIETALPLTDLNIALQNYVLRRISQAKRADDKAKKPSRSVKIIYTTLYNGIGATTRQKQRTAKDNLYTYLDELIAKGYITGYVEEKTKSTGDVGVLIKW